MQIPYIPPLSRPLLVHSPNREHSSCDLSKAKGGDGIPPLILNQAAAALVEPVHHLFLYAYLSPIFPQSGVVTTLRPSINQVIGR